MTKTNKTLLCALLALFLTLACALTIMPVAGTKANAEEALVAFNIAGKKTNISASTYEVTNGDYKLSAKGTNMYEDGDAGYRIGSKSSTGSFEFTVPKTITKIIVYAANYNSDTGTTISINGGTATTLTKKITVSNFEFSSISDYDKIESEITGTTVKITSSKRALIRIIEWYGNAASHTHAYSEWKHVDGTKTHAKTCNVEGCDAPTVTEACTIVNNVCTVCNYDYTAKFTVKETVVAAEGQTSLAIDAEGQFSVTYNVTANQGINMMQGDLVYNSEKLTLVSVEAGNAFGNDEKGNNNITVTNDVTLAEQKVVASVVEGKTGVLATVTYKLKAGVTEVVAGDFGMTVKATAGNEYVADGVATVEANTITVVVLKGVTITLNDVALTYTGASLTVGAGKDVAYTTTHGEDYTGEAVVT